MSAAAIWQGLRLVVVDLETCVGPDNRHRVVSIGVVTCRRAAIASRWQTLVDPGCKIDAKTRSIHHITDEMVADAPTFADVAPTFLAMLAGLAGESVVLCAHYAAFDVPVIREELAAAGLDLPDTPVLDTHGGLLRAAGVRTPSRRLDGVLAALGITNAEAHEALSDAAATAKAAFALIEMAAAAGVADLAALLAAAGDPTTGAVAFSGPLPHAVPAAPPGPAATIPEAHLASHARTLPASPAPRTLAAWARHVDECVDRRCHLLVDRVAAARAPAGLLLDALLPKVEALARAGDAAATATLLGAVAPLFARLPPAAGSGGLRRAALDLDSRFGSALDGLGRCNQGSRPCPSCWAGEPCALDTWRLPLAAAALGGDIGRYARGYFETNGREAGSGVDRTWRSGGHARLADAALRLVFGHWHSVGQPTRAGQLAELAWAAGVREPVTAEAHAAALARGGREADLCAGLAVCDEALLKRGASTDDAWGSLAVRRASIEGRLERRRVRYGAEVDEDGKPVPLRRHHPEQPHRVRAARFLRSA